MTDADFDRIYEESKCEGSRDKIIEYLFDKMTQEQSSLEWLKKEIELLKREVDLLKREIEYLKPNKLGQQNTWQWPQQPGGVTTPCTTPTFISRSFEAKP